MNKPLAKALAAALASASLLAPAIVAAQTGAASPGNPSGASMTGATGAARMDVKDGAANMNAAPASQPMMHATDKRFATKAAESDLAEIATSKLALQKAESDKVKQFAQHMIDDHTKTSEKLKPMAQAKGIELPSTPDKEHQKAMAKLEKLSGDKFDREYMTGQVKDHEKAVSLFEREAKGGRDAEFKQFASETVPTLREHLQMAKDIRSGTMASGKGGRNMDRNSTGTATSMSVRGSGGASGESAK